MNDNNKLQEIRTRIDELDEQIQSLITERARCAREVAATKQTSECVDYYRPEREAEVLRKVIERNQGPISDEDMVRIYREIMSVCLALQHPLMIAFLGPEGTFTEAAALKHFGQSVNTLPLEGIEDVFREVESGAANYGVVPIENSSEGVINHTLDMFMDSPLKICGEVELRIHHHLMSKVNDLKDVKSVYSHQQSHAQCREWLDSHLPGVEWNAISSNAEAARRAASEEGIAAIASDAAADKYGLNILASNIEDEPDNTTRFIIIGRQSAQPSGTDKTSLLLSTRNRPGALHRLLDPFASHDVSMTRIESRPSRRGMWDYVFFVDIEGHIKDAKVEAVLGELQAEASIVKVLGSYPVAVL